ncbi:Prefoldin-domain-containing protein [Glomus cerebriforme]|uniref:Prefoldin-domain-containing protein n=1 Tax=Glomus cerebriforme TaxID=658196 RepID=A0A397TI38_9GLOM|nr:Prefoldin-domain-containing protein [Glomus cerebriforme]
MGKLRPDKRPFQLSTTEGNNMSTSTPVKQIELNDLDLTQLAEVKKQLEEELAHLTTSFEQLKQAQARFQDCIDSVKTIKGGNEILVPLTQSLYVSGELVDTDKVIVDVGTGYYVEKNSDDAISFYTDKVEFVKKNVETLRQTIVTKQNNLKSTIDIMQYKISQGTASTSLQSK